MVSKSKLILMTAIAMSLALALWGCAPSNGSQAAKTSQTLTVEGKWECEIPSAWVEMSQENDNPENAIYGSEDYSGRVQLGTTIRLGMPLENGNDLIEFTTARDEGANPSFKYLEWQNVSSSENSAEEYFCEWRSDDKAGFVKIIASGSEAEIFSTSSSLKDFDSHSDELKDIALSAKALEPEKPIYYTPSSKINTADTNKTQSVKIHKAGSYRVGTDIPAGEYKINCTGSHGYYCVYPDTTKADILSNGNITTCAYVCVTEGQLLEVNGSSFVAIADAQPTKQWRGDGIYKVGFDIPAGEYNLIATSDMGYYAVLSTVDANATRDIVNNDNFEGNSFVNVADGQYLELSRTYVQQ